MAKSKTGIVFVGRVLDNVHGFIEYTRTEECIINTLLFKRLQSIKQLSIVNWVFPGSEHTRYIHSLGVMYVADKIAIKLELTDDERKIVRLAGLLHDIGHYPLSHVGEKPYKEMLEEFPQKDFCQEINIQTAREIEDSFTEKVPYEFMKKRKKYHHEQIGADIVLNNNEIKDLIVEECGPKAPYIIADMIVGNVERSGTDPLLVQILHSELDADGIDYLMRDAMFSGTSFGAFELDQLIGCMTKGEVHGKRILCITPKGVAAADQYLLNKFFSYSQVVCNKHVNITEWMAEQLVNWMQRNDAYFPKATKLKKWVTNDKAQKDYLNFNDNSFWGSIQNILSNQLIEVVPKNVKLICEYLIHHEELKYVENSEVKIISNSKSKILDAIVDSDSYKQIMNGSTDTVCTYSMRTMSCQVHYKDFIEELEKQINIQKETGESYIEENRDDYVAKLFMECISVKDGDDVHLLCDDERSLMQTLCSHTLGVFRTYELK